MCLCFWKVTGRSNAQSDAKRASVDCHAVPVPTFPFKHASIHTASTKLKLKTGPRATQSDSHAQSHPEANAPLHTASSQSCALELVRVLPVLPASGLKQPISGPSCASLLTSSDIAHASSFAEGTTEGQIIKTLRLQL